MKLLVVFISTIHSSLAHAEVLDKVRTPQDILLTSIILIIAFLIVSKIRKPWAFWPYVVIIFILILLEADFIINDEIFHIAHLEYYERHNSQWYAAYFYLELFINIFIFIFSFISYFKKNKITTNGIR